MKQILKRTLTLLLAAFAAAGLFGCRKETIMDYSNTLTPSLDYSESNASLLPKITSDDDVKLVKSGNISTPDWFSSAIIVEMRIETATKEGTFEAAIPLLDYYADLGVNCLWLTPIYEKGPGGNGYGNCGLHTLDLSMTKTATTEEGWQVVKKFVDEAHKRNVRILLDVVTWGTMKGCKLRAEHPEFYSGLEAWGNDAFDWSSDALKSWFIENAVQNILTTGADGYRCDCEPNYAGYEVYDTIRSKLLEKGRKIVIISEDGSDRSKAFDTEQEGVLFYSKKSRGDQYVSPENFFLNGFDLVDSVKTGNGIGSEALQNAGTSGRSKYYTMCVTNHDYQRRIVNGNRLAIGYQAIFAPFIPLWYMGDECGVRLKGSAVLFDVPVDFSCINDEQNRLFFNDVKRYIRIRRTYPEIFEYFPDDHRKSNICKLDVKGLVDLNAYARYAGGKAVLIIPGTLSGQTEFTVAIPYKEMGLGIGRYRITNLLSGEVIGEGNRSELSAFTSTVGQNMLAVYLVEKCK